MIYLVVLLNSCFFILLGSTFHDFSFHLLEKITQMLSPHPIRQQNHIVLVQVNNFPGHQSGLGFAG